MSEDWKAKVDFLRVHHASEAVWDATTGRLVSIKLDPLPTAPSDEGHTATQHANTMSPEERRRVALGAVGGLRRVPRD